MARMKKSILLSVLVYSILIILAGCQKGGLDTLEKEVLFPLSYGKGEDELTFFHKPGMKLPQAHVAMSGGIVYVGSSQGRKVMKFNSYGDLIGLFYNSETNPPPVLLSKELPEDAVSSKQAFPYRFSDIGDIAVTKGHGLLVQDEIDEQRQEFDQELQVMLDQIVLRFSRTGELIDFLGQEGSGGTPFPYIERVSTTLKGETVVFCRTPAEWIVYWFTQGGFLKYKIDFDLQSLPVPEELGNSIPAMGTIFCDIEEDLLYVKIDYYQNRTDDLAEGPSGIQFITSYIYVFDIGSEQYGGKLEIPEHFRSQDSADLLSFERVRMIYRFLGVSRGGHLFLLAPSEKSEYELMIFTADGKVVKRVAIVLHDRENIHRDFSITPEGIVCALICEEEGAEVLWWRTDRYIVQEDEQGKIFRTERN
jgi:hypothetical protein